MADVDAERKLIALPTQIIRLDEGLILKRGRLELRLKGDGVDEVVAFIFDLASNGISLKELVDVFPESERPQAAELIAYLESKRFLVPTTHYDLNAQSPESDLDIFFWHFGKTTREVIAQLNEVGFGLVGVNTISRRLASSLLDLGISNFVVLDYSPLRNRRFFDKRSDTLLDNWPGSLRSKVIPKLDIEELESEPFRCLVVTSDVGSAQIMRAWNEYCVQHNRHFLPVVLQDLIGFVGPLIVPGETACYECLRARENANMKDPEVQRASEYSPQAAHAITGFHPSMGSILGDIAAIELTKFYGEGIPTWRVGTLIKVNLLATRMSTHRVLRLPRCPICSPLNTQPSTSTLRDLVN